MWGPEYPQQTIMIDEIQVPIRDNLACFLDAIVSKWLEQKKKKRAKNPIPLHWIDQICVDQSNIPERNSQVSLMRDIYSRAERVTVWLGNAADRSDLAMQFLGGSAASLLNWLIGDDTFLHRRPHSFVTRRIISEADGWVTKSAWLQALYRIRDRPYWTRVWIIQEILCSRDCLVCCGTQSITWKQLSYYMKFKTYIPRSFQGNMDKLITKKEVARNILKANRWGLDELLIDFYNSGCADPRDRIYALLGLMDPNKVGPKLEADYSKSTSELFDCVLRYRSFERNKILQPKESKEYLNDALQLGPYAVANSDTLGNKITDLNPEGRPYEDLATGTG